MTLLCKTKKFIGVCVAHWNETCQWEQEKSHSIFFTTTKIKCKRIYLIPNFGNQISFCLKIFFWISKGIVKKVRFWLMKSLTLIHKLTNKVFERIVPQTPAFE